MKEKLKDILLEMKEYNKFEISMPGFDPIIENLNEVMHKE